MLEWLKERKLYVFIVVLVLGIGGLYYFSMNKQTRASNNEQWAIEEPREDVDVQPAEQEKTPLFVDVKGAVNKPGVYEASEGDRVLDVIKKAGGLNKQANESAINLAMRVTDEMVLYVPKIGEEAPSVERENLQSVNNDSEGSVNINKATENELQTLTGIGPAKALAIIEYRESNGPFKKIEDIMEISGFGEKTFAKLKDSITVK